MSQLFTKRIDASPALRCLLPLLLLILCLGLCLKFNTVQASLASPEPASPPLAYSAIWAGKPAPDERALELSATEIPLPIELEPGQTLGGLLATLGLDSREAHLAAEALSDHVDVRRIKAGESCLAYFDKESRLSSLRIQKSGEGWATVARIGGAWASTWSPFRREVRIRQIRGELTDFLGRAIRKAGAPPALSYKMADVLQWDLDFNRDLQAGDRFKVLFEEVFLDGRYAGLGNIQALTYENRGRLSEAYRYGQDDAYYDGEGRPLRKLFLRSPLTFTRVTSRFSRKRFHPILKVYRPHYGVDYGAPKGTPVRVTANGVVISAAWNKGGGKTVKVRHGNGYMTAYLHLSGYAKGVRSGRRVRQGQVIGYVGSTGLSTGPHLDYRVQVNGRWIDPLSLPNVPAEPIPEASVASFMRDRDAMREGLGGVFPSLDSKARLLENPTSDLQPGSSSEAAGLVR